MTSLLDRHDVLLSDLDGTLYAGRDAIPHAVDAVVGAAAHGVRTAYVTNNASRRAGEVADHLAEIGFPATAADVMTSAQAGAALLAGQLDPGSVVLVVGADALAEEIAAVGLVPVREAEGAVAVVQGHSTETGWRNLAEASIVLRRGGVWVATNVDTTLPTDRGLLPGNGSMVAVLRTANGREPQVAGKPGRQLVQEAVRRSGTTAPLVIGDRLDTDIEGGFNSGLPTLLVLTGVNGPADVLAAVESQRPSFIAADLTALSRDADELAPGPRPGWTAEIDAQGVLVLGGAGASSPDPDLDALRTLCAVHWAAGGGTYLLRTDGAAAAAAADRLGLAVPAAAAVAGTNGRPAGSATVAATDAASGARP